jgi:UDP-N-acetylmuramoyl-L-alanyl-D-glutamate--2,6-diaminopimelate ligase
MANLEVADILTWLKANAAACGLGSQQNLQLSSDSRSLKPGDVFIACPGQGSDGRRFIVDAIEKQACAVIHEAQDFSWNPDWTVPHLAVTDLKKLSGQIANTFYAQPDQAMFTIAVTGTNGKTSCSQWLGHALSRLGEVAAVIGTLGVGIFRKGEHAGFSTNGYTTPDATLLQRELARLRDTGVSTVAIEASSIGLEQQRMRGMHVDVALFTNLTRDHLDYHHDMAAYEAAKTILFDWPGLRHAVINLDDAAGLRLVAHLRAQSPAVAITGYSIAGVTLEGVPVLRARDVRTSHAGSVFHFEAPAGAANVKTRLIGDFNVSNVLGVIGVLLAKGVAWRDALAAAETLVSVPGRMQQLGGQEAPLVVIDYAHTPDALEKAITTLRKVATDRGGKLWCVFGCGGDRDPGKRAQMGAISQAADHVVVTSDNPRSEDIAGIIAQIVAGMDAAKISPVTIEDRAGAILWAVRHAARADVVLLAGKGHETHQEIKGKKLPFLDAEHAAIALGTRVTMKGAHS